MTTECRNYEGPHTLNLTPLQGRLKDLDTCRGLRPDQEGFGHVKLMLAQVVPVDGAAAGVPQDVYDHFVMCNDTVDMIDQQLAIARRQLEVLEESRAFYVDARNNDLGLIVDAIRSRAQRRKDPSLLLPFGTLIEYHGQTAEKAVRTRRKNAEAVEAEPGDAQPQAPTP